MRQLLLILLCASGLVHAESVKNSTTYCPVPNKHMKAEFFTLSQNNKFAETTLKERSSGQVTRVYIRSEKYILDKDILKNILNYSPNDRQRTPQMMLGCNKCFYDSPYTGITFYGCIQ